MPEQVEVRYPSESLVAAEIARQPILWPTTLERIRSVRPSLKLEGVPVIVTGAGTSGYAAAAVADAWPGARAIHTTDLLLQTEKEIATALPAFAHGGLLLSLARSGDSPESVGVVEKVKRLFPQVRHVAILCNAAGRLANTAGVQAILLDPRTNDRSLAMTASFSNLVLGGLSLLHGERIAAELTAICSNATALLPHWNEAAMAVAAGCGDRIIFLASNMSALTLEASIKVMEMTAGRVKPLAESFLGLRHGPLTFARDDTPIVCLLSSNEHSRLYEKDLLEDLREKQLGKLVVIGDDHAACWPYDFFVKACAPTLPAELRTPFEVVFSQLLAFHLSRQAGIDPDDPSPGGVVTRVVRPFRLHEDLGYA